MAFFLVLLFCIWLYPSDASAWGIGFHLQVGQQLLSQVSEFAPRLQALLSAYPLDYLYGCIAADITLGKKYTHYLQHCHSWRVARQLLDNADGDPQTACAYGYISHLAMDCVAHSYFVPYKTIRSFNTLMLKHAYWELRVEAEVKSSVWPLARTIARKDFSHNDALLRATIADTLFSFGTNKRLFNSLMLLSRLKHWQKMLRSISRGSRYGISSENLQDYSNLALEVACSILADMDQSPYWKADPAGERALSAAKEIRKNLNLLWLEGKLPEAEAERLLLEMKIRFRSAITCPDRLLDLLSAA